MKSTIHSIQYSLILNEEQWKKLNRLEYFSQVIPVIENAGGSDITYNNVYGNRVFYVVEYGVDVEIVENAILSLVN